MSDLSPKKLEPTPIYCDNSSAITLSKNQVFNKKSKHIDIRYHFIRELVNEDVITVKFCKSADQQADIFTKPLQESRFLTLKHNLGLMELPKELNSCNLRVGKRYLERVSRYIRQKGI